MLEINIPEIVEEVRAAFMRYELALVTNETAVLNELFWDSTHTVRFGVRENLYGFTAIAAFRKAGPGMDLTRMLKNTVITTFGRDFATANTEFQRHGSTMTGRQSHTWIRSCEGWKIAAAHVSLLQTQS
jgi:hypothetical protein